MSQLNHSGDASLSQYFTPDWAAELLVEKFFPHLGSKDQVLEPSCGYGAFLKAIPAKVPALGVELDPALAKAAAQSTGRTVLCGDFRTIPLPVQPTVVLGNPPFNYSLFDAFLARARRLLPPDGQCGFILPSYFFQTSATVMRWHQDWSLEQHALPRDIFYQMSRPLVFCLFTKAHVRTLHGFVLYPEQATIRKLPFPTQLLLIKGTPQLSGWNALVYKTLEMLGGTASCGDILSAVGPRVPKSNRFPAAKIRQTLQRGRGSHYVHLARNRWAIRN